MNILEKEIEDIVAESRFSLLRERGLEIDGHKFRQLNLGSYGIADIVTFKLIKRGPGDRVLIVHVYELKKDDVNVETMLQALSYCKGIQRWFKRRTEQLYAKIDIVFKISLIGKKVDLKSSFIYSTDIFFNLNIYTYKIDLEKGIVFKKEENYSLTNEHIADDLLDNVDIKLLIHDQENINV